MEVTKKGIEPSTWREEVICPRCEAHLKISYKDIFMERSKKKTFFSYKYILHYLVKCPTCGKKIILNENKLPNIIKRKVIDNMDLVDKLLMFYFS